MCEAKSVHKVVEFQMEVPIRATIPHLRPFAALRYLDFEKIDNEDLEYGLYSAFDQEWLGIARIEQGFVKELKAVPIGTDQRQQLLEGSLFEAALAQARKELGVKAKDGPPRARSATAVQFVQALMEEGDCYVYCLTFCVLNRCVTVCETACE